MDEETADGYSTPSLYGQPADAGVPATGTSSPPERQLTSRRGVLVAGALFVVAGAGAGVAVGRAAHKSTSKPSAAIIPADLGAAISAEQHLLAGVDAELRGARGANRATLRLIRSNHAAHLTALQSALADAIYPAVLSPTPTPTTTPTSSAGAPPDSTSVSATPTSTPAKAPGRTALRAAERAASTSAAKRALAATGTSAVLLASIAACEATHAELLA